MSRLTNSTFTLVRAALICVATQVFFSNPNARALEAIAAVSGDWSNTATWTGGVLPGVEDDVKIPAGLSVTLNADVECGGILVEGRLSVERANRTLLCDSLLVQGAGAVFEVGTSASRFLQTFTLTLKGLATESPLASMGAKVLGAHNGGTLDIHGRDRVEWTKLGSSAAVGATSITLSEPVDWAVGDSIMVTSTRRDWNEAETRTITSVSADLRTVSFTPGLTYPHSGGITTKTRSVDGKSWTADLRAEVGLLSRNVKIQGDAESETAGYGGHIMVMNGGTGCCITAGKGFIESVELFRMGQKSLLGRYPMHWHMVAEGGVGQYFRDSVVRHSFNRAITIHGTESTLVENNFCYDHLGHGIFLEDGSERFNVIRRNVVLATKRPVAGEEILETDNGFSTVQNRSPASFWITNPNNTFTDNVAAGTQGTGFWFAFPQKPLNASASHPRFINLQPYKEPLGAFDGNVAHSCASGLDINDQISSTDTLVINGEWANNGPFFFNNCTWFANDIAIYAGIGGERKNVVYFNNVFSDNVTNLFLATYQLCEESLMIADSGFGLLPTSTTRTVYAVYDGAGRMKKNHLVGYNASNTRFLENIGAATKHPNHYFESLTFDPPVPPRSSLTNYNIVPPPNIGANDPGHPRIWASVIVDVDGSISGVPNSSIVSNHPFMLAGGETRASNWIYTFRSDRRFAQCRLTYSIASDLNPNISVIRTKAGTPTAGVYYIDGYKEQHQLPLIVRNDFLYSYFYDSLPSSRRVNMIFGDAVAGDDTLIRFVNFGKLPGLAVAGMTSQVSLAALKAAAASGFYKETNGDLYVRPVATTTNQSYTITWTSNIVLPVVDSDGDGVSDGDEAAAGTDPFHSTNTEPTISEIPDQAIYENTRLTALDLTLGDLESNPSTLTVSGSSSNTALVPNGSIVFAGSGPNRTVSITPAENQAGTSTITVTVSDGTTTASASFVLAVVDPNVPITITAPIATGADDAEESAAGAVSLSSTDLELVHDGTLGNQTVGLRFTGIAIPPGSVITDARIQFAADEIQSEATILDIAAEATDHAAVFTGTANNLSGRAITDTTVLWEPAAWSTVGESAGAQLTPNLAAVVQDIVSRPGWASGNAIAFLVEGTGHRTADAFEKVGGSPARLTVSYTVPRSPVSAVIKVSASGDDAEESAAGASVINSTDLELVNDGALGNQTVGMRFNGIGIPNGASILAASIQFTADETQSEATALTIRAEAANSAAIFTTAANNVSSRPRTSSAVSWVPPAWLTIGESAAAQRTPDLTSLMQEVINRPGWVGGNSLAFIITGTGHRTAEAFDKAGGTPPTLTVSYLANPPVASFAQSMSAFPTLTGANAQLTANPDGDAFNNLLEYALATNPALSNSAPYSVKNSGGFVFLTYTRPSLAPDITYSVEWSDTLTGNGWSTTGVAQQVLSDNGVIRTVRAYVAAGAGQRFLRIKVAKP